MGVRQILTYSLFSFFKRIEQNARIFVVPNGITEGLLKPGVLVDVNTDGVERVTNGSYAFIKVVKILRALEFGLSSLASSQEKSYLEFAVEKDYVRSGYYRLSVAKQEFFKVNFAFALPTTSPLKTFLDKK